MAPQRIQSFPFISRPQRGRTSWRDQARRRANLVFHLCSESGLGRRERRPRSAFCPYHLRVSSCSYSRGLTRSVGRVTPLRMSISAIPRSKHIWVYFLRETGRFLVARQPNGVKRRFGMTARNAPATVAIRRGRCAHSPRRGEHEFPPGTSSGRLPGTAYSVSPSGGRTRDGVGRVSAFKGAVDSVSFGANV